MRKVLTLLTVFVYVFLCYGSPVEEYRKYEIRILTKLVKDVTKKNSPTVYFIGTDIKDIKLFKELSPLKVVKEIKNADFIFVKNLKKKIKLNKPTFALDFDSLKYCPDCFGIFSWRNGRPMLIIFKEIIHGSQITLPEEYKYFIDSRKYVLNY